jgi:hypothetical protein
MPLNIEIPCHFHSHQRYHVSHFLKTQHMEIHTVDEQLAQKENVEMIEQITSHI